MLRFIKTTIAGGLLFILPLVLLFILIEKAIHLLRVPLKKIEPLLAEFSVAGITSLTMAALVVLSLACFLAGLLAQTRLASAALEALEERVLSNLPGYQLLKDAATRVAGLGGEEGAKVSLVNEGEGFRFGLVLEQRGDWLLVYMPDGGPAGGTAGEVRMVPCTQISPTDISWISLLTCLRRGGRGLMEQLPHSLVNPETHDPKPPTGETST